MAEVLQPPVGWSQPFRWGLLMVLDPGSAWELPDLDVPGRVHATSTCATASVLHAADVETFEGWPDDIASPPARVDVVVSTSAAPEGSQVDLDRELSRVVAVHPGAVRLQLSLFPRDHADVVVLRLLPGRPH